MRRRMAGALLAAGLLLANPIMSGQSSPSDALGDVSVGRPLVYEDLTVFPLSGKSSMSIEFLTLDKAIRQGLVQVQEKEDGDVNSVRVRSTSAEHVFGMAGEIVTTQARKNGAQILPIDSEPSAIWQCLRGEGRSIARLVLTASGGPFRQLTWDELAAVTPQQALIDAAQALGARHHVGITRSADSFYARHPRPGSSFNNFWQSEWAEYMMDLKRLGVLGAEMEASIIFVLARVWGLRAGACWIPSVTIRIPVMALAAARIITSLWGLLVEIRGLTAWWMTPAMEWAAVPTTG